MTRAITLRTTFNIYLKHLFCVILQTLKGLQKGVEETLIPNYTVTEKMRKSAKGTKSRINFLQKRNILSFRDILSKSMTRAVR